MNESCENCKFEDLMLIDDPCCGCDDDNCHWEAKCSLPPTDEDVLLSTYPAIRKALRDERVTPSGLLYKCNVELARFYREAK